MSLIKNAAGNIEENIDRNGQLGTLKIKQQANVNILWVLKLKSNYSLKLILNNMSQIQILYTESLILAQDERWRRA